MNDTYISHHDDCKGKWQSHEVSFHDDKYDWPTIVGYGGTKKEALEAFTKEFNALCDRLNEIRDAFLSNNLVTEEVDCFGDIIYR